MTAEVCPDFSCLVICVNMYKKMLISRLKCSITNTFQDIFSYNYYHCQFFKWIFGLGEGEDNQCIFAAKE